MPRCRRSISAAATGAHRVPRPPPRQPPAARAPQGRPALQLTRRLALLPALLMAPPRLPAAPRTLLPARLRPQMLTCLPTTRRRQPAALPQQRQAARGPAEPAEPRSGRQRAPQTRKRRVVPRRLRTWPANLRAQACRRRASRARAPRTTRTWRPMWRSCGARRRSWSGAARGARAALGPATLPLRRDRQPLCPQRPPRPRRAPAAQRPPPTMRRGRRRPRSARRRCVQRPRAAALAALARPRPALAAASRCETATTGPWLTWRGAVGPGRVPSRSAPTGLPLGRGPQPPRPPASAALAPGPGASRAAALRQQGRLPPRLRPPRCLQLAAQEKARAQAQVRLRRSMRSTRRPRRRPAAGGAGRPRAAWQHAARQLRPAAAHAQEPAAKYVLLGQPQRPPAQCAAPQPPAGTTRPAAGAVPTLRPSLTLTLSLAAATAGRPAGTSRPPRRSVPALSPALTPNLSLAAAVAGRPAGPSHPPKRSARCGSCWRRAWRRRARRRPAPAAWAPRARGGRACACTTRARAPRCAARRPG